MNSFVLILVVAVGAIDCNSCERACKDPQCARIADPVFTCYNPTLGTCYGNPTGYTSVKWCTFDCSGGLVLYYDCMLGRQPACPPRDVTQENHSSSDSRGVLDLAEGFNTNQDLANSYNKNAQLLSRSRRQEAYLAAVNSISALAYAQVNFSEPLRFHFDLDDEHVRQRLYDGFETINATSPEVFAVLEVYVQRFARTEAGLALLQENNLGGFFDFCKDVVKAVGSVIDKAFRWCTSGVVQAGVCKEVGKTAACAVTTFFGFPICFLGDVTDQAGLPSLEQLLSGNNGYDSICLSNCQSCLEYAVPGFASVYCKYDDYKTRWLEASCLQSCPTQTRHQLLGSATTLEQCWKLCETKNVPAATEGLMFK